MTAEITIMNKQAVAMAADSAVTVRSSNSNSSLPKIYNTANKLFALSKYQPVGIMIYGNGTLLGIPWESIIKSYRKYLGKEYFTSLVEYGEDFLSYIATMSYVSENDKKQYFLTMYQLYLKSVVISSIDKIIKEKSQKNSLPESEILKIVDKQINEYYNELREKKYLLKFNDKNLEKILKLYDEDINDVINNIFEKIKLNDKQLQKLRLLSGYLFSKDIFPDKISGIVIAGFGENEIFPTTIEYVIETVIDSKVKYKEIRQNSITSEISAAIMPFAQHEMVDMFMTGIDPVFESQINIYLDTVLKKYPENIVNAFGKLSKTEKEEMTEKLIKAGNKLYTNFSKSIQSYSHKHYITPIINSVSSLPKPELAEMAEALVNLTSFKRRMSKDVETVGGPTDVAIISKGDGFVWIKRKHYFDSNLNHQFKENYFRCNEEGDKKWKKKRNFIITMNI